MAPGGGGLWIAWGRSNIGGMTVDPAQLQIICYPDPRLRAKAGPIEQVTDGVRAVAARMLDLMHQAPGVGLAAPQVGLDWRMFVCNTSGEEGDDHVWINPVLNEPSRDMAEAEEGCLSLPEIRAPIQRPEAITITALNLDGQTVTASARGLTSRIWQHETDHLDGVLITDRMAPIDRMVHRQALREMEKEFNA